MGALVLADDAACVLVVVLAVVVARRSRPHWRIAAFFAWIVTSDALALALRTARAGAPRPYEGLARISFHVDELITLSLSFLPVVLCVHFFLGRRVRLVLLTCAAAFAICCASYPALSKDRLAVFYEVAALGSIVLSWGAILWGVLQRRHVPPSVSHLMLILYGAADTAIFVVRVNGRFFESWPVVQLANILLFLTCAAAQLLWLNRRSPAVEAAA